MEWLKYTKAVVAGVAAVLIVVTGMVTGEPVNAESIIAVLGALGVYALPNKETKP